MKSLNDMQVKIRANRPTVTERWKIFCETIQNKRADFEVFVPAGIRRRNINKLVVKDFLLLIL
jgi:hypothetical protein